MNPQIAHTHAHTLTFHGRLDNRKSLADSLSLASPGSAEVALAGWLRWGDAVWSRLLGDWSAVLHHRQASEWRLATDFVGARPMYYQGSAARFRWSFDLASLIDSPPLDSDWIAAFLDGWTLPGHSPYCGIRSVPPGHFIHLSPRGETVRRHWTPPVDRRTVFAHEQDYEEALREQFTGAVRCRIGEQGAAAAELSGGLDSSSVVCESVRQAGADRVRAYHYGHEGLSDEVFARDVAQHLGVAIQRFDIAASPYLTAADGGSISPGGWQSLYAKVARALEQAGERTMLNGLNGDLIMGNHWDDCEQAAGHFAAGRFRQALVECHAWSRVTRLPLTSTLRRAALVSLPPIALRTSPFRSIHCREELHPERTRQRISELRRERSVANDCWRHAPPERRKHFWMLGDALDSRVFETPLALRQVDYTSPFLDRQLVEFMLTIPAAVVSQPGEPRRLMRRAFHRLLPQTMLQRRSKSGYEGAFLQSLRPLAENLIDTGGCGALAELGLVDPSRLRARLARLALGLPCEEHRLRRVILLEYWLRSRPWIQGSATTQSQGPFAPPLSRCAERAPDLIMTGKGHNDAILFETRKSDSPHSGPWNSRVGS